MGKKILIVEDELDLCRIMETRLQANGYQIISAQSGEEALKKAQSSHPDLIVLDILLPGMDGFEVFRQLKKKRKTKNIPVILLTSLDYEKAVSKGLEEGAACFITKPYRRKDLLDEIENCLN